MSIKQTLASIRKFEITAAYDRETREYRIDFRRGDPRHVFGHTAYHTDSAGDAILSAEAMCDAPLWIHRPTHIRQIAHLQGVPAL